MRNRHYPASGEGVLITRSLLFFYFLHTEINPRECFAANRLETVYTKRATPE